VQTTYPGRVITAVVFPRTLVANVLLVTSFALLTWVAAQIVIPVPGTPVPITGQTFAVLLSGASLGKWLGSASQLLYVSLGAIGLPFYADGAGGWEATTGATAGYLFGFIAAAWVVGFLAERRQDRKVSTAIPAFLAGNAVIYLFGVTWLAYYLEVTWQEAAALGLVPFIIGDILKIVLAGLLLPAAWKLVGAVRK
jgi:biotin transport system substrate-specific component